MFLTCIVVYKFSLRTWNHVVSLNDKRWQDFILFLIPWTKDNREVVHYLDQYISVIACKVLNTEVLKTVLLFLITWS